MREEPATRDVQNNTHFQRINRRSRIFRNNVYSWRLLNLVMITSLVRERVFYQ